MTKWGWPPSVSSNFSKKETSQVSPGLRHSSFCKTQWHDLTSHTVTDKTAPNTNMKTCLAHQNGDDAFVLLLYQVTNDFVVKVLHCFPLKLERNILGEKNVVLAHEYNKYNFCSFFVSATQTTEDSLQFPLSHTPPAQISE